MLSRLGMAESRACYSIPHTRLSHQTHLPHVLVKVREAIKLIESDGWWLVRTKGSHRQFKHAKKQGTVTIAGKPNHDLPKGTLNSILKQADLKR